MAELITSPQYDEIKPYWVLLVDVLGVRKRINNDLRNLLLAYRRAVQAALDNWRIIKTRQLASRYGPPGSEVWAATDASNWRTRVKIFSDSIFVFFDGSLDSDTYRIESPYWIGTFASQLSLALWQAELPHRGAVAYGDCALDHEHSIFLGPGIARAYEYEQRQKWLGIALNPEDLQRFRIEDQIDGPRYLVEADARVRLPGREVNSAPYTERTLVLRPHSELNSHGETMSAILGFNLEQEKVQSRPEEHDNPAEILARYRFTRHQWRRELERAWPNLLSELDQGPSD